MKLIKQLAGLFFALSFICMACLFVKIPLFTENKSLLKTLFLIFGALGLVFNLLSFNYSSKGNGFFNFLFWFGAIVLFFGLIFKMFHYPFHNLLLIIGFVVSASSFLFSKFYKSKKQENSEIIDQF